MANTKSAIKNARKTVRKTERNKAVKSRVKTLARNLARIDAGASPEEKKAAAIRYISALDKAAKAKVIHHNQAERHKAACAKYIFHKAVGEKAS